ncbi:MAG: radical SAM protein [Clostridiales bacterium]|nr:radical SAM protein [Clostridiales bacterium]
MKPKRHIIPVFVPHLGCPNDCVFCNQRRISGILEPAAPGTVRRVIKNIQEMPDEAEKQLAFYGGSFTAIPVCQQKALLEAAQPFLTKHKNASLRISTRPDHIDEETLRRLSHDGVATIELGAQSMSDEVLAATGRGHTAQDVVNAARLIKRSGFELILQMMTGLPGDTPDKSVDTAEKLIALEPDGVRIYPAVVIRDTKLHDMWRKGEYAEHTVEDAVSLCAVICELFEKANIPVIRLGLNPTEDLSGGDAICGAYHPALGALVQSRVYLNRARQLLRGRGDTMKIKRLTLGVPQGRVSAMTGHRRSNIEALEREFGIARVSVAAVDAAEQEIVIMSIENEM